MFSAPVLDSVNQGDIHQSSGLKSERGTVNTDLNKVNEAESGHDSATSHPTKKTIVKIKLRFGFTQ